MHTSLKTADFCFNSISLLQDRVFYQTNERRERHCHQGEIKRSILHQSQGHHIGKQTHLMETYAEVEQHFQQLNADLLSSTKENGIYIWDTSQRYQSKPLLLILAILSPFLIERDMFDQRNQQFSTILLATTIMLGALISCLAQGVLPNAYGLGDFVYYIYSISTSISVAFLFICLVFCVEVLWRASKFMYKRSKYNTGYLAKAIKKTKDMMGAIRGVKSQATKPSPRSHTYSSQEYPHYNKERDTSNTIGKRFARRRNVSNMSEADVQREFVGYENETGRYHTSREAMIDESAFMVTADDGSIVESKSFERFWRESCSFYGNAAILFFYAGSAALFFVNVTFMWAVNLYTYKSVTSAKLCAIVILVSLLLSMVLLIYIRYIERISMDNSAAADEAEGDKYSWGAFRAKLASISTSSRLSGDGSFSRGMGRLSSFMGSGPRCGSSESSVDEDSGLSDRYDRDGVTTQRRKERCSSKSGRHRDALPVAVSLDIPLNFQDDFDELYGTLSSADATFPQTTYPTGTIDSRHVAVSTTR